MLLDPQVQRYLDQMSAQGTSPVALESPEEARWAMESETSELGPLIAVDRIEDHQVPGSGGVIHVRLTAPRQEEPLPVLVYAHGGGWVVGSTATHEPLCRSLTVAAGIAVVSVEYRRAPEHRARRRSTMFTRSLNGWR